MANWYGAARTNSVTVLAGALDKLKESIAPFHLELIEKYDNTVVFISKTENGDWPFTAQDDEGNDIEFDMDEHILQYLTPDSVLIMMEAGSEKLRYITGVAIAYRYGMDSVKVSLDDIYKKAEKKFNKDKKINITQCAY